MFNRRSLAGLAAALSATGLFARSAAAAPPSTSSGSKHKVAYHVSDADKVDFVLRNMQNHIDGVGGPGKIDMVLVAHGPALRKMHNVEGDVDAIAKVSKMMNAGGVRFSACGNTMQVMKFKISDMPKGTTLAEQGGVVRLAQLQERGYTYIRP